MTETRTDAGMRKLGALLRGLAPEAVLADCGQRVASGLYDDSRRVQPGGVFVALQGSKADGRRFIVDALAKGAAVVVGEALEPVGRALVVNVSDARAALTTLALRWHGLDADGCCGRKLAGVTGTNGKSTSAFMTRAILRAAGTTASAWRQRWR